MCVHRRQLATCGAIEPFSLIRFGDLEVSIGANQITAESLRLACDTVCCARSGVIVRTFFDNRNGLLSDDDRVLRALGMDQSVCVVNVCRSSCHTIPFAG